MKLILAPHIDTNLSRRGIEPSVLEKHPGVERGLGWRKARRAAELEALADDWSARNMQATNLIQVSADSVAGVRGIFGGRLRNAHQVEAFTANLISVNRRYKAHSGLRVTDV